MKFRPIAVGAALILALVLLWLLTGRQGIKGPKANAPERPGPATSRSLPLPRSNEDPGQVVPKPSPAKSAPRKLHRVCVDDANDDPVPDLGLVFYCSDTSARLPAGQVRTDSEGCIEMQPCLSPDSVTCVRLSDPRHRTAQAWVIDHQEASSQFTLAKPATVSGQLVDEDGRPVQGAQIWFEAQDPDPMSAPAWVQTNLTSDEQGRFQFVAALPAPCDPCVQDEEDCELTRRPSNPYGPEAGKIWIRHPEHPLSWRALPETWGTLSSIELPSRVAQITVGLSAVGRAQAVIMLRHRRHRRDRQSIRIKKAGEYSFRGLGQGEYEMSVFQDGRRVLHHDRLRAGDRVELELPLAQESDIP